MSSKPLQVICLCAAWCGTCATYRQTFDDAARDFTTGTTFSWIDIEDQAELVDDVEVENFPTLLLARNGLPVFFGPLTPQPGTLARLVQSALDGGLTPLLQGAETLQPFLERIRTAP